MVYWINTLLLVLKISLPCRLIDYSSLTGCPRLAKSSALAIDDNNDVQGRHLLLAIGQQRFIPFFEVL